MSDEENKHWFKGTLAVTLMLLKGLAVPASVGLIGAGVSYPLGYLSCKYYAQAKEIDWKYSYWKCYLKTDENVWLTKDEFVMSSIGMRLVIEPELKIHK